MTLLAVALLLVAIVMGLYATRQAPVPDDCLSIDDLELLAGMSVSDGAQMYPMLALHLAQCERCRRRLLEARVTLITETTE